MKKEKVFPPVKIVGDALTRLRLALQGSTYDKGRYTYAAISKRLELADESGGWLSKIEKSQRHMTDETLYALLTNGYGLSDSESRRMISEWRIWEAKERYSLKKKKK